MLLEIVKDPQVPRRIILSGELDTASTDQLREAITPELLRSTTDLALELTDLTFMDSAGLHVLISTARSLSGDLVLVNPSAAIRRLLEVSGVDRMPHLRVALNESVDLN
jgi:anti-sigma B factor antagonist